MALMAIIMNLIIILQPSCKNFIRAIGREET
ncbi:hypothetical protein CUMW_037350 [Citrus unshiu]|nr:hypothetical protein CUMW_037350 [Citrus unshiu]